MAYNVLQFIPEAAHPAVFSMCSLLHKHMELKEHITEEDHPSSDIQATDILLGHVVDDICVWVSEMLCPQATN